MKSVKGFSIFIAFLALTGLALAALQEGIVLQPFVIQSDQWKNTTTFDFKVEVEEKQPSKENQEETPSETTEYRYLRKDAFKTKILEVEENLPAKVQRDYTKSTVVWGSADAKESEQADTPLQDASLVLQRDGDGTKLVSGGSDLPKGMKETLDIDVPSSKFLPSVAVKDGDQWAIEGDALLRFLNHQLSSKNMTVRDLAGSGKIRFNGIEEEEGKRIAGIEITEARMTAKLGWTPKGQKESLTAGIILQVTGDLSFDVSLKRTTKFNLSATILSDKEGAKSIGSFKYQERSSVITGTGEGILLAARFLPEDLYTQTQKTNMTMSLDDLVVEVNGSPMDLPQKPEITITVNSSNSYVDKVIAAEKSRPKKIRREFLSGDFSFEAEGAPMQAEVPNPWEGIEGSVIILERDGETVTADAEEGDVEEGLLNAMTMGDEFRFFLPEDAVSQGDTWEPEVGRIIKNMMAPLLARGEEEGVDIAAIVEKLLDKLSANMELTLESISEEGGNSIAFISIESDFELEITEDDLPEEATKDMPPGLTISVMVSGEINGECDFDAKWGKPTRLSLRGPFSAAFDMNQENEEAGMSYKQQFKMSGNFDMEQTLTKGRKE